MSLDFTNKDQAERDKALDIKTSFIIQAPAGSGKTDLLTKRFLKLLSVSDNPENILAMTFTKKAADEMKTRIMQELTEGSTNDPVTKQLSDEVKQRNKEKNWRLEELPHKLHIQTIDSFLFKIVRLMPWSSRFGDVPQLLEEDHAAKAYKEAAKQALQDPKNKTHIDNLNNIHEGCIPKILTAVADNIANRDKWLPYYKSYLKITKDEYIKKRKKAASDWMQTTLSKIDSTIKTNILSCIPIALSYKPQAFENNFNEPTIQLKESIEHLEKWRSISSWLLTTEGKVRKKIHNKQMSEQHQTKLKRIIDSLNESTATQEALSKIKNIPPFNNYTNESWDITRSLINLSFSAVIHLKDFFITQGVSDFQEIFNQAKQALGSDGNPSDLMLRIDQDINHILIDELQDTSTSQLSFFESLISEWSEQDGKTLFLVGDPMQSIYRFRGSEVTYFQNIQQDGFGKIKPENLYLNMNFRSDEKIVKWLNSVFSNIFPSQKPDTDRGDVTYSEAIPNTKKKNTVPDSCKNKKGAHIHFLSYETSKQDNIKITRSDEIRAHSNRVLDLIKSYQSSGEKLRIGVLAPRRKYLEQISKILREEKITHRAIEIETLSSSKSTQDLIALTVAIVDFTDSVSWLSILRAPWCGLSLHELESLVNYKPKKLIIEKLEDSSIKKFLTTESYRRIKSFTKVLLHAVEQVDRIPLKDNVRKTWFRLNGPSIVRQSELQNCTRYFEIINSIEKQQIPLSLDYLSKTLEKEFASTTQHEGNCKIDLMTIHKSKGLEFDIVILPFVCVELKDIHKKEGISLSGIHNKNNSSNNMSNITLSSNEKYNNIFHVDYPVHDKKKDIVHTILKDENAMFNEYEENRVLYVACSRAKNNLHLISKKTENEDVMSKIRSYFDYADEKVARLATSKKPNIENAYRIKNIKHDTPKKPLKTTKNELDKNKIATHNEKHRIFGLIAHKVMEYFNCQNWTELSKLSPQELISQLPMEYIVQSHSSNYNDHPKIKKNIVRVFEIIKADDYCPWLFSPSHIEDQNELPISGFIDNELQSIIIDRTFVTSDNDRWIVDYKFSQPQSDETHLMFLNDECEKYKAQLEKYASLMQHIDQERPIKLALYFPFISSWRYFSWTNETLHQLKKPDNI